VDAVSGVSFSPDGNQLATVSRKTIQIWDTNQIVPIHTEKIVEIACNRLTKNLSRSQWAFFFHEEEYELLCPNSP
jgi:WD40 repeat protein